MELGLSIYKLCKNLSNKYKITIISLTNNYYREKLNLNKISLIKLKSSKTIFSFKEINVIISKKIDKEKIIFISNINYSNALSCALLKKIKILKFFL